MFVCKRENILMIKTDIHDHRKTELYGSPVKIKGKNFIEVMFFN